MDKNNLLNFKNIISVSMLIISLSVFYYFVISLPKVESTKQSQNENNIENQQSQNKKLWKCISLSETIYTFRVAEYCRDSGKMNNYCLQNYDKIFITYDEYLLLNSLSASGDNFQKYINNQGACLCKLPVYILDSFAKEMDKGKEDCYKLYK